MSEFVFDLPGRARVLFSDRSHGNLSSVSGEGREFGEQARERLREAIGARGLARGYQVHGTRVVWVSDVPHVNRRLQRPDDDADGQATARARVGALVLTADCLPVALARDGAVAMLHAGWRGLAAGVLEEGVKLLRAQRPGSGLTAVIGPGAGACCYEVGPEVHASFGERRPQTGPQIARQSGGQTGHALAGTTGGKIGGQTGQAVAGQTGGQSAGQTGDGVGGHSGQEAGGEPRARIDLRAIARERLLAAGVEAVHDVDVCTICDERFFSHRREGARAGRQGGVAWLE